ncbi:hypothetical protein CEB3_c26820 [Peptococcaceae bacterium CEB3]|nr:hypothetical protein CEB3_c26820 [Peptococcaceae bacterium CEB3]
MLCISRNDPLCRQLLKENTSVPNKYHNFKVQLDGRTFASRKEANRYAELKHFQRAGIVQSFACQVPYIVFDAFRKNGRKYRSITYVADFVVQYPDGHVGVEDTKGGRGTTTEAFRIKRKLFEARYPELELRII